MRKTHRAAPIINMGEGLVKGFYLIIGLAAVVSGAAMIIDPTGRLTAVCAAFAMSFGLMQLAVRNILAVAYRKKLYDLPGGRRIHTTPTPRLGGLAFAPIIVCVVILAQALRGLAAPGVSIAGEAPSECLMWVSALIFIHMTGTVDDLIGVKYPLKFSAQIVAALLVVASGFWINDLGGLFGLHALPAWAGIPLTVVFIVGMINALNLIDGMDGLAAGVCMIALVIYGVHCFVTDRFFFALSAFAALGTLAPFFYTNVKGIGTRRRKLFMGDTGSQTMGLVVSVLVVGQIMNTPGTLLAKQDLVLALSPLVVPVFDVAHVVLFRMLKGKNPFRPDMTHIHHRLVNRGFNTRRAVVFILCLTAAYVTVNMFMVRYMNMNVTVILALDAAAWCALNGAIGAGARRRIGAKDKSYATKTTLLKNGTQPLN